MEASFSYMMRFLWAFLAEALALPLLGLRVVLRWITFDDEFFDDGFRVRVYLVKGFFFEYLWPKRFSGVSWIPGVILLSPTLYMPGERDHCDRVLLHELFHMRQWRKWGILFPLVYGIFSLKAWPRVYWDNRFEVEARAAVDKAYPQ
jgi:hypothetical protein